VPEVRVDHVAARPTLVVAATTTWAEYPRLWGRLLDEVYAAIGPDRSGRQNVMLYRDDVPNVEVGVLDPGQADPRSPAAPRGGVVASTLPAGRVATAVHRGDYANLGTTHRAVLAWCHEHGELPAGPRWEVYGHWAEPPAVPETEVSYLLL
jgi:hypothetical protein